MEKAGLQHSTDRLSFENDSKPLNNSTKESSMSTVSYSNHIVSLAINRVRGNRNSLKLLTDLVKERSVEMCRALAVIMLGLFVFNSPFRER